MITLKSPPRPARRVLHMNCASSSPGGKDYVLVQLDTGELWGCNGPAFTVRNGGGAEQHPKKSWQDMVSEKTRKGYTIEGEYSQGTWWARNGHCYNAVHNIAITKSEPETPKPVPPTPVRTQQQSTLAEQYPVSRMVKEAFGPGSPNEWFYVGGVM